MSNNPDRRHHNRSVCAGQRTEKIDQSRCRGADKRSGAWRDRHWQRTRGARHHAASGRSGRLVSVNCAAIPSELLESEIFGHEKGAFTGADKPREGRVELARGGTLFLDEIGDMPLPLQTKLLRVLENRTVQRVGGNDEIEVDFRLVCATHQNIQARVDEGAFRADLYYRINVFPIQVPSLAERQVDIPLIVGAIMEQLADGRKDRAPVMDNSALTGAFALSLAGECARASQCLERAMVMFPQQAVTGTQVRENLLRMKAPDRAEEMDALWEALARPEWD